MKQEILEIMKKYNIERFDLYPTELFTLRLETETLVSAELIAELRKELSYPAIDNVVRNFTPSK